MISLLICFAALAAPATAPATRDVPRVLVISATEGFRHQSIPLGNRTIAELGRQSGAFEAVVSDDFTHLDPGRIAGFAAIVFQSTTGELKMTEPQRQSLIDFVAGGGGFVGIHSATDTFYGWPEYGDMIGAYFDGHPWNAGDTITLRIDAPDHPIARPWAGADLTFKEEIYQFRRPYDRSRLTVLLSLDVTKTDMSKSGIRRRDGDFALAWIKPHGDGRVFYTALGHNESVWRMEAFRQHLLAGIRHAIGEREGR
jgi:type 1 glutamine amidotransferase